jgi:hypothetical protein
MTTVGMPGHGFTFPVEGIVPVIFSSMVLPYPNINFPNIASNFHFPQTFSSKWKHLQA